MKSIKYWWMLSTNSFQQVLINRHLVVIFLIGKSIRIIVFLLFLYFLFSGGRTLIGYSREEVIFFFLTFNVVDTLSQLLFREVYRFRTLVIGGGFDFVLVKPVNPLIRVLLGGADLLDLLMLIILGAVLVWFGVSNISAEPIRWLLFGLLVANALVISAALHITTLGLGVMVLTVDHIIMIYRDLTSMMRVPVGVYATPIRFLLTFVIPLGIMYTFPAQELMNMLSWQLVAISFVFGIVFLWLTLKFWNYSIRFYQSAGG